MTAKMSRVRTWTDSLISFGCVVLMITAAKIAIAEPYYVPSGSMQPTLLIGDELLATKYPYGYSTASLPASIVLPSTSRLLGDRPRRPAGWLLGSRLQKPAVVGLAERPAAVAVLQRDPRAGGGSGPIRLLFAV